jgi:flagellar basal-body rod protein FlgB
MAGPLDAMFGIHADALAVRGQRLELIASNIANADTPGFKARDLDFARALAAVQSGTAPGRLAATDPAHIAAGAGAPAVALGGPTVYRTPTQPSLDGNTVDAQREHAAFAQAALEYQASLRFVEGKVRTLLTAITGE